VGGPYPYCTPYYRKKKPARLSLRCRSLIARKSRHEEAQPRTKNARVRGVRKPSALLLRSRAPLSTAAIIQIHTIGKVAAIAAITPPQGALQGRRFSVVLFLPGSIASLRTAPNWRWPQAEVCPSYRRRSAVGRLSTGRSRAIDASFTIPPAVCRENRTDRPVGCRQKAGRRSSGHSWQAPAKWPRIWTPGSFVHTIVNWADLPHGRAAPQASSGGHLYRISRVVIDAVVGHGGDRESSWPRASDSGERHSDVALAGSVRCLMRTA